jgi:hypothetical protein
MGTYSRSNVGWIVLAAIGLAPLIATAFGMLDQPIGPDFLGWLTLQKFPRFARAGLDVAGIVLVVLAVYRLLSQNLFSQEDHV